MGSVLLSLLLTLSQAQTVRPPLMAANIFPGAYSQKEADAFSFLSNQAALAAITSFTAGVYGERKFLLQELSFYQVALCAPTTSGKFGLMGSYSGESLHYEGRVGLAYGRKLGEQLDVGVQFNYQGLKVAGYGTASTVYIEAGALWHVQKQVQIGVHVSNPTSAAIGKEEKEVLPLVCTAGVGYEVSPQFFVAGELEKETRRSLAVNAGMQYRFEEHLWARAGFRSATSVYYLGIGVALKDLRLDIVGNVHPQLGLTPGLQLIFNPKEKKS